MSEQIKLISPDGKRTWSTADRAEATNLRAKGWRTPTAADETPAPAETVTPDEQPAVELPTALADGPSTPADKAALPKSRK